MLERIVYVSRAAAGVGPAEVHVIIRAAHARNGAAGLSGALIFRDGWFAQLIEGPSAPLAAAFARIAADPRHHGLDVRVRVPVRAPLFCGQAMALRYRNCLTEGFLTEFDYRPGFPVAIFPIDVLTEFVIRACRQGAARGIRHDGNYDGNSGGSYGGNGPAPSPPKGWTSGAALPKDGKGSLALTPRAI